MPLSHALQSIEYSEHSKSCASGEGKAVPCRCAAMWRSYGEQRAHREPNGLEPYTLVSMEALKIDRRCFAAHRALLFVNSATP